MQNSKEPTEGGREGRKEGKEGREPSRRHLREEERRGPSNLINEINLSAIFGGNVGKGKRGSNTSGPDGLRKCKVTVCKKDS